MKINYLAIFFASIYSVKSGILKVDPSKTNLKEGDNLTLTTTVTLLPNETMIAMKWFHIQEKFIASATSETDISISVDGRTMFGNRFSVDASSESDIRFLLNFINLRANDSITLRVKFTYQNTITSAYTDINCILVIDVKADPVVLSFPEVLFVNEGNTLFVESIVYGKPPPTNNIVYGDQTFNPYNYNYLSNNAYKHFYNVSGFYVNNCGSLLLLNVFGNGITTTKNATVYVLFTPGMITLSSPVEQSESFVIVLKWYSVPSGACGPVKYNIELLNDPNHIVGQFYGINTTSFSTFNNANATYIRIYAVYNRSQGPALIQTIPPPQPIAPIATATTKATIKTSKPATTAIAAIKDFITVKISTLIGLAVGLSILFVGLLVTSYFFGFHRHKKLTKKKEKVVNKDNGVGSYQDIAHLTDGNVGYQKLDAVNKVENKDNGLSSYQEIVHLSEGNASYQKLNGVNTVIGKNTSLSDICYQNYKVSNSA